MKTVRTIEEVRRVLRPFRASSTIGLVPTMGAFHDGHVALFRAARAKCDQVVASLFVNPTQFGDAADLAAYPRDPMAKRVRALIAARREAITTVCTARTRQADRTPGAGRPCRNR